MYVETLCSNFSIICILSATNGENVVETAKQVGAEKAVVEEGV